MFPSKHPMGEGDLAQSNVLMTGYGLGHGENVREYVLPTMEGGKLISKNGGNNPETDVDHAEVVRRARARGLHNYPSFKTPAEASAFAEREHGNVDAEGFLVKPQPKFPLSSGRRPLGSLLYRR